MNDFIRGMTTIGMLTPEPMSLKEYPPQYSEWQWVANSFARAGYNIWLAMNEIPEIALQEKSKTH